jgi:hypothetical protein
MKIVTGSAPTSFFFQNHQDSFGLLQLSSFSTLLHQTYYILLSIDLSCSESLHLPPEEYRYWGTWLKTFSCTAQIRWAISLQACPPSNDGSKLCDESSANNSNKDHEKYTGRIQSSAALGLAWSSYMGSVSFTRSMRTSTSPNMIHLSPPKLGLVALVVQRGPYGYCRLVASVSDDERTRPESVVA